jgi:hypothetical protein
MTTEDGNTLKAQSEQDDPGWGVLLLAPAALFAGLVSLLFFWILYVPLFAMALSGASLLVLGGVKNVGVLRGLAIAGFVLGLIGLILRLLFFHPENIH